MEYKFKTPEEIRRSAEEELDRVQNDPFYRVQFVSNALEDLSHQLGEPTPAPRTPLAQIWEEIAGLHRARVAARPS